MDRVEIDEVLGQSEEETRLADENERRQHIVAQIERYYADRKTRRGRFRRDR